MAERERVMLRRGTVAFIFQSFGLIPMLSAAENVGIPLRITGTEPREREERVAAAAQRGGAGGTRQAAAERAVGRPAAAGRHREGARRPPQAADRRRAHRAAGLGDGRQIMRLLRTVVRSEGITALVATHDALLTDLADDVLTLEDGQLAGP